jgi:hypothetical protein
MPNKFGIWFIVFNLFILAGLILDVFCFKGMNLWWLWILLSLGIGAAYGKYVSNTAKREAKEVQEWEKEVDSIRETFNDLEQRSSRNPTC